MVGPLVTRYAGTGAIPKDAQVRKLKEVSVDSSHLPSEQCSPPSKPESKSGGQIRVQQSLGFAGLLVTRMGDRLSKKQNV
jgi:hypothetical protein